MPRFIRNHIYLIIMNIMLAVPRMTFACSACVGRSDDAATQGLNAAVLTLLAALLLVMGVVVGFIAYLVRQSAKNPLALPRTPGGVVQ